MRRHAALRSLALAAAASLIATGGAAAQHDHRVEAPVKDSQMGVPESIRLEHEKIHTELVRATQLSGPVGAAARELAAVLHPHFVREEQIALPPLGLLAALARGEHEAGMQRVLPMTDSLRAELPRMLQEHKAIHAATLRLGEVAGTAKNESVARLAEDLKVHAQSEEDVFYPAAILVGDLVRMHLHTGVAPD